MNRASAWRSAGRLLGITLAALWVLGARAAHAQMGPEGSAVRLEPLFSFGRAVPGLTPFVLELRAPREHAVSATADVHGGMYAGSSQRVAPVRLGVSAPAGQSRAYVVPLPLGADAYRVYAGPAGGSAAWVEVEGPSGGPSPATTFVAVVGLGGDVAHQLAYGVQPEVVAAVARTNPVTGEPLWPLGVVGWGGIHAVVASGEALLRAPPEARRALDDFVTAGGVLVIAPRTEADLRDPWITGLIGPVEARPGETPGTLELSGERLARLPFGVAAEHALGAVIVLRADVTRGGAWVRSVAAVDLANLGRFVAGRSNALLAPFALPVDGLASNDYSSVRQALRTRVELRPALVPITVILAVYVVLVGLILRRERVRGTPLRAFSRIGALALGAFAVVVAVAYVTRGTRSTARAAAFFEVAAGAERGVMHVVADVSAGRSTTFDLWPGEAQVALVHGADGHGVGALRWDGRRVGTQGARLGIWESGVAVVAGMTDTGGAITVSGDARGEPVVHNGSRFVIRGASLRGFGERDPVPGTERVYLFGPIAPGASAGAQGSRAARGGSAWDSYFDGVTAGPDEGTREFVNAMLPAEGVRGRRARGELWALVDRPAGALARLGPFEVAPGPAVLRVVIPPAFERGAPARAADPRWVPNARGDYSASPTPLTDVERAPEFEAPPGPPPTVSAVPESAATTSAGDAGAGSSSHAGGQP